MPETTVNGRNFENETEARLYQEALDMVNGNESDIHEDTLRSVVGRHNNEDIFREASSLAHTLGFTSYEAELNEQYDLIRNLEAASSKGESEVAKVLLNDRDQTSGLSNEEHLKRYENALTRAGFTNDQIKSILEEYQMINPTFTVEETEKEEPKEEKTVVVKDEDQNKKKVGVSADNVVRLTTNGSQTKLEEAELLLRTVSSSNKRVNKRNIWKDSSQLKRSKSVQADWEKELANLEKYVEGMKPSQRETYKIVLEKIKKGIDKNKSLLENVEVREFGKQADGSYKGGRIDLKNANKLGLKAIKLNLLNWPRRQLRKIWYKLTGEKKELEQQDLSKVKEATNKLSKIEQEKQEVINKINTVSRYCLKITNMGIAIQHTTLEEMQKYYDDATDLIQSINECSPDVKSLIGDRIEHVNAQYQDMKGKYGKYIQENVATVETELNRLHASIGDDQEHDIKKEQNMLKLVQKLYPTCTMVMDDQQKEQMSTSIKQAEAELKNKAIYLKYKDLFERTKGIARLNSEVAATKLNGYLDNFKNEEFAEAIKYNKNDLIAFFENEKNQMLNLQPEKKEENEKSLQKEETKDEKTTNVEPEKIITIEPEKEVEVTSTGMEQPQPEMVQKVEKSNPTPEFVLDKQVKTIFARQKQQIDEQAQKIQEQNEIIANLQKQLAEVKAQETLQAQKKEAKDNMMSTIADIKKEARELGTQKTHLEWEINSLKSGVKYLDEIKNMPMVQNELSKITDEQEKRERLHQLAEGYAEKKNKAQIEQKEKELGEVAGKLQNLDDQITQFSTNYQTMVSDVDEIKKKAEEERQQKIDAFGNDLKEFEQQKIDAQKKALEDARVNIDDLFATMEGNEKGKSL